MFSAKPACHLAASSPELGLAARTLWVEGTVFEKMMPVRFPQGASLAELSLCCERCKSEIPQASFKGTMARLIPEVVSFEGVGRCSKCRLLTPCSLRVREAQGKLILERQDGNKMWHAWPFEPGGHWAYRIAGSIAGMFRRRSPEPMLRRALQAVSGTGAAVLCSEQLLDGGKWLDLIESELAARSAYNLVPVAADAVSVTLAADNGLLVVLVPGKRDDDPVPGSGTTEASGEAGPFFWKVCLAP